MKIRTVSLLLVSILLIIAGLTGCKKEYTTSDSEPEQSEIAESAESVAEKSEPSEQEPELSADAALIRELMTNKVLRKKSADSKEYITSTKLDYTFDSHSGEGYEPETDYREFQIESGATLRYTQKEGANYASQLFDTELVGKDILTKECGQLSGFLDYGCKIHHEYLDPETSGVVDQFDFDYKNMFAFELAADADTIYASASYNNEDHLNPAETEPEVFAGKIQKSGFLEDKEDENVAGTVTTLQFIHSQRYIRMLSEYLSVEFFTLDFTDVDAVDKFFEKHDIHAKEKEGRVTVDFNLNALELLKEDVPSPAEGTDWKNVQAPRIDGSWTFDKATGEFMSFRYDLADYFETYQAVAGKYSEQATPGGIETVQVKQFVVEASCRAKPIEGLPHGNDYTEYSVEEGTDFWDAFSEVIGL